ncbi:hypothetical protein [Yinghuangia soli]|uniref:Uncharacterized protein n=1 Tax=Yinghuangia soli TaxID=2908204 RepID=A0AA41Q1A6_9ACTN|nr:hypothetical protein [Yinghuangia soli]MCF2528237.1 hypothetical protein [Yinghuangia soli]
MTGPDERKALDDRGTVPVPLLDLALRMVHECPGGIPPARGFALPRPSLEQDSGQLAEPTIAPTSGVTSEAPPPQRSFEEMRALLRPVFDPLPRDVTELQSRIEKAGSAPGHVLRSVVADLFVAGADEAAALVLAREAVRIGTTVSVVHSGIALLQRFGEREDVPSLAALGSVREFRRPAVRALERLDRREAAILQLTTYVRAADFRSLVSALWHRDETAAFAELVAFGDDLPGALQNSSARWFAEACRLPRLLGRLPATDTAATAQAGRLLVRMAHGSSPKDGLSAYAEAPALYELVVARARHLAPTLDHHAMLLSVALELGSGTAVLLPWPPGRRAALLAALERLLAEPAWASTPANAARDDHGQRRRADWIRRTGRQPFALAATGPAAFRIEVVAADPAAREEVETRILVDGCPFVAEAFGDGRVHSPETLLDTGALRATADPREVQLAEASCTEGCCGALYVTIRRDGDTVVWERLRNPDDARITHGPVPAPHPPLRFDAAAYDAEVARAEADRSWAWPSRNVAKLLTEHLTAHPELLGRWDARLAWCRTVYDVPDAVDLTVRHVPGGRGAKPESGDDALYFRWCFADDGTPPEAQAAAVLRRLAAEDIKQYAVVSGGRPERARELGYDWPEPRRRLQRTP